jgi:sec-independent protein translocase protein TatA
MGLSLPHILLLALVVLLLFGSGKISGLMGDVAKGIKSFKKNMAEDDVKDASMAEGAPQPPAGSLSAPPGGQPAQGASAQTTRQG